MDFELSPKSQLTSKIEEESAGSIGNSIFLEKKKITRNSIWISLFRAYGERRGERIIFSFELQNNSKDEPQIM